MTSASFVRGGSDGEHTLLAQERARNVLASYHYLKGKDAEKPLAVVCKELESRGCKANLIIDSGAFSAHTMGMQLSVTEYGKWMTWFKARWEPHVNELWFMNLDVVGDQYYSWRNQRRLEAMGHSPIPIITYGAPLKDVWTALEQYEYVAFGGYGLISDHTEARRWTDLLYQQVMKFREQTGLMRKTHMLGVTTKWYFSRYPIYSTDSTTWTNPMRYGAVQSLGLQLPQKSRVNVKDHKSLWKGQLLGLRNEIRRFKRLEEDTTALWKSRGIYWED